MVTSITTMHTELFQKLGLAQNEARIYETLLREGESPVGHISTQSKVHRRNVYDSLNRLIEKGLVFEILQRKENAYKAVDPRKLADILGEKQRELEQALPELESLYQGTPHNQDVFVYRGIEGWKNYIRDIIRVGQDLRTIGGKAQLDSPRLRDTLALLRTEMGAKGIKVRNLYDSGVRGSGHEGFLNEEYRFLPEEYSTTCTTAIMADRIVIFSGISVGDFDEDVSFTVIVNPDIAAAHRKWWEFMWRMCEEK